MVGRVSECVCVYVVGDPAKAGATGELSNAFFRRLHMAIRKNQLVCLAWAPWADWWHPTGPAAPRTQRHWGWGGGRGLRVRWPAGGGGALARPIFCAGLAQSTFFCRIYLWRTARIYGQFNRKHGGLGLPCTDLANPTFVASTGSATVSRWSTRTCGMGDADTPLV